MKVRELMTANPATCSPGDSLASVAKQMWDWDCGIVPVVEEGRLLGVVTDRDICMALLFQGSSPATIAAKEILHGQVYTCSPDDDAADALERRVTTRRMRAVRRRRAGARGHARRLPAASGVLGAPLTARTLAPGAGGTFPLTARAGSNTRPETVQRRT